MSVQANGQIIEHGQVAVVTGEPFGEVVQTHADYFKALITDPHNDGGTFYELSADLPHGEYVLLPQLAMADYVGVGGLIWVEVVSANGAEVLKTKVQINSMLAQAADELIYPFKLEQRTVVKFRFSATRLASKIYMRYLSLRRVENAFSLTRQSFDQPATFTPPSAIKYVLIGTTSVCNATCVHCPTNKKMLSHLPTGVMTWEIFEKIILGLRDYGVPVAPISFGLFAEPFNDPLLIERLKFAREHLPDTGLEIATNGAAYDSEKHSDIFKYVTGIAIHVEAATDEIYNDLMRPLKTERAFPAIAELIKTAKQHGVAVWITSPVHRKNLAEIPNLRRFVENLGVPFAPGPIANRCTSDLIYDSIKLAPVASTCRQDITDGLVIDWDGSVLSCCIDFLKRSILGDLREESFAEIMDNSARRSFHTMLKNGYWNRSDSCRNCVADRMETVQELIDEVIEKDVANGVHREQEAVKSSTTEIARDSDLNLQPNGWHFAQTVRRVLNKLHSKEVERL